MVPTLRFASLLLAALLGAAVALFATHAAPVRADTPTDSITVFVDATFGFRKDHLASQLNKSHAKYAAKGYRFAAMQTYAENGDLQGMFVTYTRD